MCPGHKLAVCLSGPNEKRNEEEAREDNKQTNKQKTNCYHIKEAVMWEGFKFCFLCMKTHIGSFLSTQCVVKER